MWEILRVLRAWRSVSEYQSTCHQTRGSHLWEKDSKSKAGARQDRMSIEGGPQGRRRSVNIQ